MKYNLIYADPPWSYRDKCNDGDRGAGHKYSTMTITDLCRLPVWELADDDCLLAMWWVPPMPAEALRVIEAWGFRLHNFKGFTWAKVYPRKQDKHAIGMGHMTRANSEDMLFAVRGRMLPRLDASICQLQVFPRLEHSAKPPEFRDLLVRLVGDVPRIELFARNATPGWHTWGNECPCDVELLPAISVDSHNKVDAA